MNYTISPRTAEFLNLLTDFEALTNRAAALADSYLGSESEKYCDDKIFPAAAVFRKELEGLLMTRIEDTICCDIAKEGNLAI